MTLGKTIHLFREKQNMTQKELAAAVGVTTGTIAEWEADESAPNLTLLSTLCDALSVSSDTFLATATNPHIDQSFKPASSEPMPSAQITPARKKNKKIPLVISIVAACLLIAVAVVLCIPQRAFSENAAAIEAADASVVKIYCYDYDGNLAATGSGFVAFDSKTIITNYHVMTSAYTCKISTNQDISYEVSRILCYSKDYDIAILQLAQDTGLQPLTLGDSSIIKKGETVVAIGSPLGIKNTVSTGVLSGRLMDTNMDVLQFTAPISSGSSGGALFDDSGNVVGITFASIIDGQNLNLAIPIELAISLYQSRGAAMRVSVICVEEHPYVAYLEKHPIVHRVTLTDLKANPEKYDNKVVRLTAYVSSFYQDPDRMNFLSLLFVSEKGDISYDIEYDYDLHYKYFEDFDFQECPSIECWLDDCVAIDENIQAGQKITIIGEFFYTAKGEVSGWNDYVYPRSYAGIDAIYVYVE